MPAKKKVNLMPPNADEILEEIEAEKAAEEPVADDTPEEEPVAEEASSDDDEPPAAPQKIKFVVPGREFVDLKGKTVGVGKSGYFSAEDAAMYIKLKLAEPA